MQMTPRSKGRTRSQGNQVHTVRVHGSPSMRLHDDMTADV